MLLVLFTFLPTYYDQTDFERLLPQLPPSAREKVTKNKRPQTRWASLLGRLLVQRAFDELGKSAICSLADLQYSQYNRPFIAGSGIDFNIAHSADCVVCAVTTHGRLGVDVEEIRPIDIAAYYEIMLEEERTRIEQSSEKLLSFYQYWTAKECVIKADGKGLGIPLNSFCIEDNKAQLDHTCWYIREVAVSDKYVCQLAVDRQSKTQPTWVQEIRF